MAWSCRSWRDSDSVEQAAVNLLDYKPGDVLAFSGRGCISRGIRFCARGPITHVAEVVPCARDPSSKPVLCEALMETGVTWTPIHKSLRSTARHGGYCWHYPLAKPLDGIQIERLWFTADHIRGTPYDFSDAWGARTLGFGWLRHLVGRCGWLHEYLDNGKLFCSEAVAIMHNAVGLTSFAYPSHWAPTSIVRWERRHGILAEPILRARPGKVLW